MIFYFYFFFLSLDQCTTVEKEWSTIIIQIDQELRHSKMTQSIETE